MDAGVFGSITALTPVATSTTRAKVAAADVAGRKIILQLDPDADKKHYLGDSAVTAAGGGKVFCVLSAGQDVELPLNSTNGFYIVAATGGTASKLYGFALT